MDRSVLRSVLAAVFIVMFFLQMCIAGKVLNDFFDSKNTEDNNSATTIVAVWSLVAFASNMAFAVLVFQSSRADGEKLDPVVVGVGHVNLWITVVLFGLACKQPAAKMEGDAKLGSPQKAMSGWGILASLFSLVATPALIYLSTGAGSGDSYNTVGGYQQSQYQQGGYQDPYQPPVADAGYNAPPSDTYGLPPQQQ